jgi:pyrimidine operon attenuation protein/uracil phosphoribosyltransferase
VAFVGIRTRGVYIAEYLIDKIEQVAKCKLPLAVFDINLYRDDFVTVANQPVVNKTEIPFEINNKNIILVDDVLYTGRTIRAALDEIIDFGRPKKVELAVLIDRGHRELPIQANYIGKIVKTKKKEMVEVKVKKIDNEEAVKKIG